MQASDGHYTAIFLLLDYYLKEIDIFYGVMVGSLREYDVINNKLVGIVFVIMMKGECVVVSIDDDVGWYLDATLILIMLFMIYFAILIINIFMDISGLCSIGLSICL